MGESFSSNNFVKNICNSLPLKKDKISRHSGGLLNLPKLGFNFEDKILSAVDFPIPLVPTKPKICPSLGMGNLCNLNVFGPYLCTTSLLISLGKLIMDIDVNGHFFTQIPQPIHNVSLIYAIFEA